MDYHCGHKGCDICGAGECAGTFLTNHSIGKVVYNVCDVCAKKAIKFAVYASEEFSTIIDLEKPCGNEVQ